MLLSLCFNNNRFWISLHLQILNYLFWWSQALLVIISRTRTKVVCQLIGIGMTAPQKYLKQEYTKHNCVVAQTCTIKIYNNIQNVKQTYLIVALHLIYVC